MKKSALYYHWLAHPMPLEAPSYAIAITVTEEVNGYAVWRESWCDGEQEEGTDRPLYWFRNREEALESAIDVYRGAKHLADVAKQRYEAAQKAKLEA